MIISFIIKYLFFRTVTNNFNYICVIPQYIRFYLQKYVFREIYWRKSQIWIERKSQIQISDVKQQTANPSIPFPKYLDLVRTAKLSKSNRLRKHDSVQLGTFSKVNSLWDLKTICLVKQRVWKLNIVACRGSYENVGDIFKEASRETENENGH